MSVGVCVCVYACVRHNDSVCVCSGISKPVVRGTRGLHPGFLWFSSFSWLPWFH